MSTAVNKITVTRLQDGTTYTSQIVCSMGDLIQYFDSTRVLPDWSDTNGHPVLVFHTVSTVGDGETDIANMSLYFDGVKVIAAPASTDSDGRFQLAKGAGGLWRCYILKNLVAPGPTSNSANHTIRMLGEKADGGKIQASIAVSCAPLTDSGRRAVIIAGDSNCFTVDQAKNNACVLKAMLYDKGIISDPPNGFAFQWFRQSADSGWDTINGATGQTLTINASSVETMAVYRVRVYNSSKPTEEYYDVQSVMDIGDPYYLNLNVCEGGTTTSASATFAPTEAPTAYRTLRPSLINRSTGSPFPGSVSYYWSIIKPDGVYANNSSSTVGGQTIPDRTTAAATLNFPAALIDIYGQLDVICEADFSV